MLFWLICVVMAVTTAVAIFAPMLRKLDGSARAPDVVIYRAQLAEIDRDVARDVLAPDEAERARVEISRRLLAADQQANVTTQAPHTASRFVAVACAVLVAVASGVTYRTLGAPGEVDQPLSERIALAEKIRETRPSQEALEAAAPKGPAIPATDEYLEMVGQLRAIMTQRIDDQRGWALLAEHEAKLGNFQAAAAAQTQLVTLKGDTVKTNELTIQIDLMVQAAGGYVSPEVEALTLAVLDLDSTNTAALYHLGALYAQTGRADVAFRFWRPIVDSGEASFHASLAHARINDIAQMAGIRYTAPDLPGPSAADIAAADDMSDDDRQAMIAGMVAQLSDRLATEGGGPTEWARLISAYGVLGDAENAALIWTEARDVFGADAAAMDILTEAARSAGVAP